MKSLTSHIQLLTISLLIVPPLLAEESKLADERFLGDPARLGTLVGNIVAGAITANPVGIVAGGVLGYYSGDKFFGKSEENTTEETTFTTAPTPLVTSNLSLSSQCSTTRANSVSLVATEGNNVTVIENNLQFERLDIPNVNNQHNSNVSAASPPPVSHRLLCLYGMD
ncbi:MAG: hypothetical protein HQL49_02410 [Gammaproteobacteria bacterium]|nr:hypothetical protein [Gammaproteobacteria bacterium]